MKKFVLVLLSFLMLASVSAQENHLESADTGVLVKLVAQLIPVDQIEILNPTCVVGMTKIERAGNISAIVYSYWTGDYGIWHNSLGLMLQNTEAVTLIMTF